MDEIKFVMNKEDFLRLEGILAETIGNPKGIAGTSNNAKEKLRLEFGACIEYGRKTAKLIAREAPVDSIPIIFNYDPLILDNPIFSVGIQREFPLVYKSMMKKSGKVSNSY